MIYQPHAGIQHVDVLIVDPQPGDYSRLLASCAGKRFAFQFASTGRDALRLIPTTQTALWVINTRLPDMSGVELFRAVRDRSRRSIVYLIGDQYDMAEEIESRSSGASLYACKPLDVACLEPFGPQAQSPAPLVSELV